MILGFAIVMLFIRRVRFRVGRWIPIVFVTLTPFLTLALNYLVDVPLGDRINLGGHPWYVLAVVFAISLFILAMNFSFMGERLNEIKKPG